MGWKLTAYLEWWITGKTWPTAVPNSTISLDYQSIQALGATSQIGLDYQLYQSLQPTNLTVYRIGKCLQNICYCLQNAHMPAIVLDPIDWEIANLRPKFTSPNMGRWAGPISKQNMINKFWMNWDWDER